jgi:hypothetical protein
LNCAVASLAVPSELSMGNPTIGYRVDL